MSEAIKNIAIGIVVAVSLCLILWALLFLHPSFGDGKFRLHVRFQDIEKVNLGTRVTYAGRAVGEVVKIEQVPEEERHAGDSPDDIYIYDLTLKIDSHIPLYDSDEITIGTSGLMGERFISVLPKRPKNHIATPIAFDEVVYSKRPHSVDDAFKMISNLSVKAEETLDTVASLVNENRERFDATMDSLKSATNELNSLLTSANESKLVDKTVGVMDKVDVLMNDMNNYGMLFHLDKTWQRDRKIRIEEELAKKDSATDTIAQGK
jgi:phospholipid/cholesterol/gamma-HCH transport system substrate-binding protein